MISGLPAQRNAQVAEEAFLAGERDLFGVDWRSMRRHCDNEGLGNARASYFGGEVGEGGLGRFSRSSSI